MIPKTPVAKSSELFWQPLCEILNAKQYRQMKKSLHTLKTRVVRVHREIERNIAHVLENVRPQADTLLQLVQRILTQKAKDKNKLYALNALKVECISKGKEKNPYEFGVKVSVPTTLKEGIVVKMRYMPGNPWDGHTPEETLEQAGILIDLQPKIVIVDKGYQGVEVPDIQILRSEQRRGVTKTLRKLIKRRSAIEPTIWHVKMDGRLGRNLLKGGLGDALHAALCGVGHNIRLLLKKLRLLSAQIWQQLIAALFVKTQLLQAA